MATLRKSAPAKGRPATRASGPTAYIPIYLSTEEIPEPDRTNEKLTIVSPDLTDSNELQKLAALAESLSRDRSEAAPYGQWPSPIRIIGSGAYPSRQHPTITPEAFDNRQALMKHNVVLQDLPEEVAWNDKNAVRMLVAKYFAQMETTLVDWRVKQRELEDLRKIF